MMAAFNSWRGWVAEQRRAREQDEVPLMLRACADLRPSVLNTVHSCTEPRRIRCWAPWSDAKTRPLIESMEVMEARILAVIPRQARMIAPQRRPWQRRCGWSLWHRHLSCV